MSRRRVGNRVETREKAMCDLSGLQKENECLREENLHLKKEIEIERRIYEKWKAMAGVFQRALRQALAKYDPEHYTEMGGKPDEQDE